MGCQAILAAGVVLSFVAASGNEGKAARPVEPRSVRLGESFSLRVGEAARVEDAEVTVTFQEVSSDSRCPKDVNCIQAGEALVLLALDSEAGRSAVLEFAVPPDGESPASSFEALRVAIVELHPQKESTKPIDPSTYVARVRVSPSSPEAVARTRSRWPISVEASAVRSRASTTSSSAKRLAVSP